jgi:hypothetical protein
MTLTAIERRRTSHELGCNLALSGLTEQYVADELGYTRTRLGSALAVAGADPVDVWQLRDHLDRAVRDQGAVPVAYTVLTEQARDDASRWLQLRPDTTRPAAARNGNLGISQ